MGVGRPHGTQTLGALAWAGRWTGVCDIAAPNEGAEAAPSVLKRHPPPSKPPHSGLRLDAGFPPSLIGEFPSFQSAKARGISFLFRYRRWCRFLLVFR